MVDSKIAYNEDYQLAQLLLSGDCGAWDRFYNEFRKKIEAYINRKFPDVFSEIAVEEIFDGVGKRLMENNYKAVREYRGECSFSAYITKATEWEIRDWLRKHSEELKNEPIDTIGQDDKLPKGTAATHSPYSYPEQEDIPEAVKVLNDELRLAFLLRYYDYFGFPLDEIRLIAKKKGISIGSITEKIVKYLEPGGQDILRPQREKQMAFQQRLEKLCYNIHKLTIKEQRLTNSDDEDCQCDDLAEIRGRRSNLEKKRNDLLKNKSKLVLTTPYEVIAEILGEDNVSTIRSRVFLAKKQLAENIMVKDG